MVKQALLVFYTYGTFKRISDIKEEEIKNPAYDVNVLQKFSLDQLGKLSFRFILFIFPFKRQRSKY